MTVLSQKIQEKTFFILFTHSDSLLTRSIQSEFKELNTHVEVISFKAKSQRDLKDLVIAHPNCNFFMDEVLVSKNAIPATTIAFISNIISESNYLWIACQSDKLPNTSDVNLKGKT